MSKSESMMNDKARRIALYSAFEFIRSAFVIRPPRRRSPRGPKAVGRHFPGRGYWFAESRWIDL